MVHLAVIVLVLTVCQMPNAGGQNVCGTLYSETLFQGNYFIIEDGGHFNDLTVGGSQYPDGWHKTGSYNTESECLLTICDGPNISRACIRGTSRETNLIRYFNQTLSAKCACLATKIHPTHATTAPTDTAAPTTTPDTTPNPITNATPDPELVAALKECQRQSGVVKKEISSLKAELAALKDLNSGSPERIASLIWERLMSKWDALYK